MSVNLGSAEGRLELNIQNFVTNLSAAQQQMKSATSDLSNAGNLVAGVGDKMAGAGKAMTAAVTLPVAGLATAATKISVDYEKQMSRVQAISGLTGDSMERISAKAREMGSETIYSATEAGQAFEYMALAGWKEEQMLAGIAPVLQLAGAAQMELGTASDIVTDNLTAFGMSADETSRLVDVMATTMATSNTNVEMLGESFKYVAPLAGNMNYSVEDVSLALGTMANSGIKASQAGTSLRRMLLNMINPSDSVQIAMDGLGISMFDAEGRALPLREVLNQLRSSLQDSGGDFKAYQAGMQQLSEQFEKGEIEEGEYEEALFRLAKQTGVVTDETKAQALATLAGATGMSGLAAIVGASSDDWDKLAGAIDNSKGSAEEMYGIMTDNLWGSFEELKSALQELALQFGEILLPIIKDVVARLQELVTWFQNLDEGQKRTIVQILAVAAAIGPLLIVLGTLVSSVGKIMSAFGTINSIMPAIQGAFSALGGVIGGITAPIIAIVAVIGILIAAFVHLWNTNEEFRNTIIKVWETIKEKVGNAIETIKTIFTNLGTIFVNVVRIMQPAWEGFCNLLAPLFVGVIKIIGDLIGGLADIFKGIIEVISGIIFGFAEGDWSVFWDGIADIVLGVVDTIIGILDSLGEAIFGIVKTVASWFGADWNLSWEEAKQAVAQFATNVIQWITTIPEKVVSLVTTIKEKIIELKNGIVTWFSELPGKLSAIWDSIVEGISGFVDNAAQFLNELPNHVAYMIGYIIGSIAKFAIDVVQKGIELGSGFLQNVVQFFQELPTRIQEFVTSAFENVTQWAVNMKEKAIETGTNFLQSIVQFFQELPTRIHEFATSALERVRDWAVNMKQKAVETGQSFLNSIIQFFQQLPGKVQSFLNSTISNVISFVSDMKTKATEAARGFYDNIVSGLSSLPSKMRSIGSDIVHGIWDGISSGWGWLKDKVADLAESLLEGAKDALGIKSPSKEFRDQVGKWIPAGIAVGFEAAMPKARQNIQNSMDSELAKLNVEDIEITPEVDATLSIKEFATASVNVYDSVADWFESIEERMANSLSNMIEMLTFLISEGQLIANASGTLGVYNGLSLGMGGETYTSRNQEQVPTTVTNNYNFYTDQPIDEIEASRLLKKTQQDIAEGFIY